MLHPPAVNPGMTDHERETVLGLIAEGSYFGINLATVDLDDTFARLESTGIEVAQEPIEHDYGVHDCAFRDPAGNLVRIRQQPTKE